jgi:outer membrane protein assembly factor BamB
MTGNLATTSLASPAISSTSLKQLIAVTEQPSVDFVQVGLCGNITADIVTMKLADDEEAVLLGTTKGLYIVSEGSLLNYVPTSSPVMDIAILSDMSGDKQQEIAIAIWDTYFPSIRCYDGKTGNKLWQFLPKQEVFADNLMWIEQQTPTFDVEALDINNDNIKDVIATSGYRIYALDGKTGKQVWAYQAGDNLWKIVTVPDLNNDGSPEIAVGGQNGFMYVFNGRDGTLMRQQRIAEKYDILNDQNKVRATVDRCIWDIIPFGTGSSSEAIVSAEDGKIRLITLAEGTIIWETEVIEYISSQQSGYYSQKSDKPTSPGDQNFFNLRACLVDDTSGDGIEEVFVSAFIGEGRSALLVINGASGQVIWQNSGLTLNEVSQIAVASIEGEDAILLPLGKTNFTDELDVIDPVNGTTLRTIAIMTGPESTGSNKYQVKGTGDDAFILASNYGDLLLVSAEGDVLWDYPRVTDIQVETGEFCGDSTEDLFINSRIYIYGKQVTDYVSRVLYVLDGATKQKVWSYEVPYEEYVTTGGISKIRVTPDINGDGKQDIAGVIQLPEWYMKGEEYGKDTRVIILSGKDGSILLKQPIVDETYYAVWEQLYKDPSYAEKYVRQWFEQQLKQQLKEIENSYRQKNLSEAEIQQNLRVEEENRRRDFEQNQLSNMLKDLTNRMAKEEKGWRINKWIRAFDVINFSEGGPAPVCFVIETQRDMYLMRPDGEILFTWCFQTGLYDNGPFGPEAVPSGVKYDVKGLQGERQLVLDDLNGDGANDLATFTGNKIYIVTTEIYSNGDLDFEPFSEIEVKEGLFSRQGWLESDLNGDGIRELGYFRNQENRPPLYTVVSPIDNVKLLEIEYDSNSYTMDTGCADLNGDDYADSLLFQRWAKDKEGPRIQVVSGRDKAIIWEYNDCRENYLYQLMNYQGSIMPACPISDFSGDGVSDLAFIQSLTYQAGAQIIIFDITQNQEIKSIFLEEIDPTVRGNKRWNPGLLVKEMEDINGDGWKELAAIIPFGATVNDKVWQLVVVDIHHDEIITDFLILGSGLFTLGSESGFGMTGFNGEVYLLNVTQNLRIESPVDGSTQTSPVTVKWSGASEVAFNQVYIDGIEVGRTNDNELTIKVTQDEHGLEVRSLDENGRGVYQKVVFTITKSSLPIILLIVLLAMLLILVFVPAVSGIIITRRHRRERHG